jgi:hypothetical protein
MNIKNMKKQYQCSRTHNDFLTVEISEDTNGNIDMQVNSGETSLYVSLSPKDALDLAKSIKKELKSKGQSKADLRAEILELKNLNAALASTQLDAVNRLECEVERLNEFIDVLYAYVGVDKKTGSRGLLYQHLDSLKYQK